MLSSHNTLAYTPIFRLFTKHLKEIYTKFSVLDDQSLGFSVPLRIGDVSLKIEDHLKLHLIWKIV